MNVGEGGRDGAWDERADRRGGRLLRRGGGRLVGPGGDACYGDLGIYRGQPVCGRRDVSLSAFW